MEANEDSGVVVLSLDKREEMRLVYVFKKKCVLLVSVALCNLRLWLLIQCEA